MSMLALEGAQYAYCGHAQHGELKNVTRLLVSNSKVNILKLAPVINIVAVCLERYFLHLVLCPARPMTEFLR